MKTTSNHPSSRSAPQGELALRALYSIPELARTARVHRNTLRRLLDSAGVRLVRAGRSLLVPLSEIESRVPALWRSLVAIEALRRGPGRG